MNIAALKTELLAGHPDTGVYSVVAATAIGQLHAVNRVVPDTERKTFRALVAKVDMAVAGPIIDALKAAASTNSVVATAVSACEDYGSNSGLDFSHTSTIAAIDALVAGGALTAAQADVLKAMGQKTISRAEELGLGLIYPIHVTSARVYHAE